VKELNCRMGAAILASGIRIRRRASFPRARIPCENLCEKILVLRKKTVGSAFGTDLSDNAQSDRLAVLPPLTVAGFLLSSSEEGFYTQI
jgi:hypothetical protein